MKCRLKNIFTVVSKHLFFISNPVYTKRSGGGCLGGYIIDFHVLDHRLIDWLINWLINWLIDWLTDWLINGYTRLRVPQDGLFTGSVDAVDPSNNTYRISFERSGLGTHSIPDYEVDIHNKGTVQCTSIIFCIFY